MTKYRAIVADLDRAFKMDGGRGYAFLSAYVVYLMGLLTYAVLLDLGVIV